MMIHIGIDFGHGETSVSRMPGSDGTLISRVPLNRGSHWKEQKVATALCRDNNENWRFVLNDLDYRAAEIREGFKGVIDDISLDDREALKQFAKLIFKRILDYSPDLEYNEKTGKANFDICIACPSEWRKLNKDNPDRYLKFFQEECGIRPIKMCINESDAAFFTKYHEYEQNDTVFVIDLGSSTIDFTTYNGTQCLKDLCWGVNLGAHIIEDKLIVKGYENNDNKIKMTIVEEERRKKNQCSAAKALSLLVRKEKENYFTTESYQRKLPFVAEIYTRLLINGWKGALDDKAFKIILGYNDFEAVISDYKKQLKTIFKFYADKLNDNNINPTRVLLSGGASRMDFVRILAEELFPNAIIDLDSTPEWVVSDGASKYIKAWAEAQQKINSLQKTFKEWANDNLVEMIKQVTVFSLEETLRQELQGHLQKDYIDNTDKGTNLYALEKLTIEAIENSVKSLEFQKKVKSSFITNINNQIADKLQIIIKESFNRDVKINEAFIDPGDFFSTIKTDNKKLHDNIDDIIEKNYSSLLEKFVQLFGFNTVDWETSRWRSTRVYFVKRICEELPPVYDFVLDESVIKKWIDEAYNNIQSVLINNELFEVTV